ncbi:hypothetical protein IMCC9480_1216 [Oxalobacteraceae bacterium IMCC9480]|nr:hypothetical protein IMCC9480_1216 [Oxalobacteraceae bacterium IMCC9480]
MTYVIGKARLSAQTFPDLAPGLAVVDNRLLGICGDARALAISTLLVDGVPLTPAQLQQNMSGNTN